MKGESLWRRVVAGLGRLCCLSETCPVPASSLKLKSQLSSSQTPSSRPESEVFGFGPQGFVLMFCRFLGFIYLGMLG